MDRCLNCQYYDRQNAKADSKAALGQCRRTAPSLSPINAKSYMIEGVWPTVRDDDWCGEWKAAGRRPEPRIGDLMSMPASTSTPTQQAPQPRIAPLTTLSPAAGAALAIGGGRGSD